jgi:hypothetical protein
LSEEAIIKTFDWACTVSNWDNEWLKLSRKLCRASSEHLKNILMYLWSTQTRYKINTWTLMTTAFESKIETLPN